MRKYVIVSTPHPSLESLELDGGLAELRLDCARMTPHWPHEARESAPTPVPAARITVPEKSAALLNGMSEYGD
ncbi:hypothetical protein G5C51_21250 [Streptomyces sp. A7024]|uniref:Uncharacterized protein n=1 Tax=Streptomyces coryli TaxID=1128680 RepID=A0A6G4U2M7_9ACTN|nr:hypothetical protein [Streptomyces coryli]NGN66414.1 hypothetical protein [Streptomyces coryli]